MSVANIRTQIKIILESVAGIGVVHDYERWAVDWAKALQLFKPSNQDKINGWMITRTKTQEWVDTFNRNFSLHHFLIRGVYSLDDAGASEKIFQDLIEAVRDKFRTNYNLNGSCESIYPDTGPPYEGRAGVQVDLIEVRTFGGVLCHYCELSLYAKERIIY